MFHLWLAGPFLVLKKGRVSWREVGRPGVRQGILERGGVSWRKGVAMGSTRATREQNGCAFAGGGLLLFLSVHNMGVGGYWPTFRTDLPPWNCFYTHTHLIGMSACLTHLGTSPCSWVDNQD